MPNICDYEMRAKGNPAQLQELVYDMLGENADKTPRTPHMARVFDAEVMGKAPNADGTETWTISGNCAWSAVSCMTADGPGTYGYEAKVNGQDWFIGLVEEAKQRNLEIEVHDCECGCAFATRIIAVPGEPLSIEGFDYTEVFWEDGFDTEEDLKRLTKEHDLTPDEVKTLREGDYVVRSNFDDVWTRVA